MKKNEKYLEQVSKMSELFDGKIPQGLCSHRFAYAILDKDNKIIKQNNDIPCVANLKIGYGWASGASKIVFFFATENNLDKDIDFLLTFLKAFSSKGLLFEEVFTCYTAEYKEDYRRSKVEKQLIIGFLYSITPEITFEDALAIGTINRLYGEYYHTHFKSLKNKYLKAVEKGEEVDIYSLYFDTVKHEYSHHIIPTATGAQKDRSFDREGWHMFLDDISKRHKIFEADMSLKKGGSCDYDVSSYFFNRCKAVKKEVKQEIKKEIVI